MSTRATTNPAHDDWSAGDAGCVVSGMREDPVGGSTRTEGNVYESFCFNISLTFFFEIQYITRKDLYTPRKSEREIEKYQRTSSTDQRKNENIKEHIRFHLRFLSL